MSYVGIVCLWYAMGVPRLPLPSVAEISTSSRATIENGLVWHQDYADATALARLDGRMVLVDFTSASPSTQERAFHESTLSDALVRERLTPFVLVRLPRETEIPIQGKPQRLLAHPAFTHMQGQPGVAIIDYAHREPELYGQVVSCFPLGSKVSYSAEHFREALVLPKGTLTQRTLIYAVRTHPETPQSTAGQVNPVLVAEAASHSQHQAEILLQGHHQWETRFHRINHRIGSDASSQEVCAESWPGEPLVEAAVECVHSWRQSPGHWRAVRSRHSLFGYDMKRGRNGIWYATGIFANFGR